MNRKLLAFAAGVSGLALTAAPAWGQDTTDADTGTAPLARDYQSGGDIVVTARRRSEAAQDVPQSIIAFNQDTLRAAAVSSGDDLAKVSPGLVAVPGSGNPTVTDFSIRGRGLNFGAAAGSVETYFAEVPLSAPFQMPQLPPQFFDIASVQVLKGPQGTLFGRSTTGGAVLIQPQTPTMDVEGYGRVQVGNYNNLQLEGAVNVPLVDEKIAVRLAAFHWKRDGYVRTSATNPDGSTIIDLDTGLPVDPIDYNNKDVTELRGSLLISPGNGFENTTIVTYHRDRNLGSTSGGLRVVRNAQGVPIGTTNSPGTGTYTGYLSSTPARPPSHSYAIVNTTSFDMGNLTLRNIFGYKHAKGYVLDGYDPDGTSAPIIDTYVGRRPKIDEQYTNELQLQGTALDDRLDFTIGGLADLIREPRDPDKLNTASVSGTAPTTLVNAGVTPSVDPNFPLIRPRLIRYLSTDIDSYALYVAGSFDITDQLTISGGYRHTWDTVDAIQASTLSASSNVPETFQDADPDVPGFQQTRNLKAKFQSDVYNATLEYKFTPDVLAYVGYRHGFKRGGFNSSAFGNFPPAFGPEKIDSYSAGIKTQTNLGDSLLTVNVEGYWDKYKGYQASYLLFANGNLLTLTANIPKATYKGVDAEVRLDVGDSIDIGLNYAYLDAGIDKFPDTTLPGNNPGLENNELTYASKHQVQASVRFHGDTDWGNWSLRPSLSYRSKFYTTLFNRSLPASQAVVFGQFNNLAIGGATVPGVLLVDMRFEVEEVAGSNFGLAVGATNLLDKYYQIGNSGTLSFGVQGNSYGPPRMVYGEVKYSF